MIPEKAPVLGALVEEAKKTPIGELSGIFRTKHGYQVIEIVERKEEGFKPIEKIRGKIIKDMQHEDRVQLNEEFLESLIDDPDLEIDLGPVFHDADPDDDAAMTYGVTENSNPALVTTSVAGDTLTAQGVYLLGRAIGTEAGELGQQTVLVARDGRLSSPELSRSLIKGLLESGRDVVNLGLVPTPVLYYGTEVLETQTGIMLTGSHNPSQHNGLKIVMNGETLHGDRIQAFKQRIQNKAFSEGSGHEEERDISDRYLNDIANDIVLARPLKIAIDCGNGVTGELAPRLFTQLGCDVTPLYTEIDGNFPNHSPDPSCRWCK